MSPQEGFFFLERIMFVFDVLIFANNSNFSEMEQEKNLPSGAIVRQSLRLAFTYSVKKCLEIRKNSDKGESNTPLSFFIENAKKIGNKDPVEGLLEFHILKSVSLLEI